MSSELLHYEDVKFRREGREILKGINWHVEEGENWALLGLNGAGKSTMLSMIPAYQIPQQDYYAYLVMNLVNMHGLRSRPD